LPPLLACERPGVVISNLPNIITITADLEQVAFALKEVIHYGQNHSTAHVKLTSGTWYHDEITTERALTLQPQLEQNLNSAICAIYNRLTIP
jgi:tRNA nucleotidyltransferase/poly(A) polymerase